ncbi:MAG: magnesium transporter [SAR202 cluster bacterium]|nr:magnesium transporter [SAR202 cluster bacterium]
MATGYYENASRPNLVFETAAEHISENVPRAAPEDRASAVIQALQGRSFDCATGVAICKDGRLAGLLSIERLLAAHGDELVSALMDSDPPVVAPGLDQELAAWKAVRQGESSLAVVDEDGQFLGLIPPHRLLSVLLWEHEEDLARLGGFLQDAATARTSSQETVLRRWWHRLPWLLLGLAGAILAADVLEAFEDQLQATVALAFFIPGVVYLADAVGTQTETLVVRGLSVGVSIGQVLWRELLTGLLVGISLSAAFLPLGIWWWHDHRLAITVSLSLLAACSTATLVAMALPWLFHRLGRDPAFASGPLATVIQDLLSLIIYLAIARVLVV